MEEAEPNRYLCAYFQVEFSKSTSLVRTYFHCLSTSHWPPASSRSETSNRLSAFERAPKPSRKGNKASWSEYICPKKRKIKFSNGKLLTEMLQPPRWSLWCIREVTYKMTLQWFPQVCVPGPKIKLNYLHISCFTAFFLQSRKTHHIRCNSLTTWGLWASDPRASMVWKEQSAFSPGHCNTRRGHRNKHSKTG